MAETTPQTKPCSTASSEGRRRPIRIGLLLFPNFSMMACASASEPFRAANRLAGETLYDLHILSSTGGAISSSSGFKLETQALAFAPELDRLFVVASLDIEQLHDKTATRFLQRFAITGKPIGALSNGSFVLARAGVLDGYRCTLHWESLAEFGEEFPLIETCREIYVRDRNRWTCAGGIAAIDLMLEQVATDFGGNLAAEVAEQFLHSRIRGPEEFQRMETKWRYGVRDERINAAIRCMEHNLETLVEISDIAQKCNLSLRHMERLWHKHFDMTPKQFYMRLRLKEAQRLLKETSEPIAGIALRCGFVSASHLGGTYRRAFGRSPGEERRVISRR
ncbi:AraC family transcriptional regulator [Thioclava atlantica]|uniref:AraC family transcriptional regulator n=1 Tax=Thioclava atlantica TaxID=1317124 RepID=A0A085TT25_9RHOB|nr:AraC family transcriptional regulator [Thioclava atlantica]